MKNGKLKAAVVGLGFGGAFVPIWLKHPDVGEVVICDKDSKRLNEYQEAYPDAIPVTDLEAVLNDPEIDCVHLLSGIPDHAAHAVKVLESGKHCACTVPMATSLDEIRQIFSAVRRSGKKYMMMETTLYTYQYFYIGEMIRSGEMGRVQFMRGSHYQDMSNWPPYWMGLPPFWYGTHALAPMIGISGSRVDRVSCLGSGTMDPDLMKQYGNPFPVETTHLHFANGMAAEATRSLFETAREYQEGLSVYGSKKSFEWGFTDGSDPIITTLHYRDEGGAAGMRGGYTTSETVGMPNFYKTLPEELWPFTVGSNFDPLNPQDSLKKGGGAGHHGSHAHLVNEFVRSILDDRKPWIDEVFAANITAAGICSHESALRNGEWVTVPEF